MLLESKLPLSHCEGHAKLTCQQFRCYWQKLAEDIVPMDVPREVISVQITFLMVEVRVSFYLFDFVLFKDLRYDFFRVFIKGGSGR